VILGVDRIEADISSPKRNAGDMDNPAICDYDNRVNSNCQFDVFSHLPKTWEIYENGITNILFFF